MIRIRALAVAASACALVLPGVASAAQTKITGGTTQITASSAAATLLSDNHITVKALKPATAAGTTFTFPIARGSINTKNLRGVIRHKGGLSLSNGTKTVALRQPTLVSTKQSASIWALVRGRTVRVCHRVGRFHAHVRCVSVVRWHSARIATVSDVKVNGTSATGTVKITAATAKLINQLAGKSVVSAGAVLGTATVSPTLK
jgi:hypothetical protein